MVYNNNVAERSFLFLVHAFTEMLEYLLNLDGAQFIFTERFCQDNLEIFFGQQRQRGRRNDNPSVEQFVHNSQAIMTSKSISSGHSSNIQRKRQREINVDKLSSPILKRKSKRRCISFDS